MKPDVYNSHVIHDRLEQLRQSLQNDKLIEGIGFDNLAFLNEAFEFIKDRLKFCNPLLIQVAELTNIAAEIESATVQINNFLGNNNPGYITNAINNLNSAIVRSNDLPGFISSEDFNFSKEVTNFQSLLKSAYDLLKEQKDKLQEELKLLQIDLTEKQETISILEDTLIEKQNEIKNFLVQQFNDFDSLKILANSTLEAERKKIKEIFEADQKLYLEQIELDKKMINDEFIIRKQTLESAAMKIIEKLEQKLKEANKIVNIVGNVGVTGNYQVIANQHKASANFFRWVTLTFMIIMSGLLIYSIIELSNTEFNLYKSLVRILAAAVLTYPAVYAAKESSRHRNLETQNRNLELELASIGPFIELLPEEKKQIIKEGLVNKYFGKDINYDGSKKNDADDAAINSLEKILKLILPYLSKK